MLSIDGAHHGQTESTARLLQPCHPKSDTGHDSKPRIDRLARFFQWVAKLDDRLC